MTGIEYEDFVDTDDEPTDTDLVCEFVLEPGEGMDMMDAAGRVASESSNGTWAALNVPDRVTELSATTFEVGDGNITVAYPGGLFEEGNMAQVLSASQATFSGRRPSSRSD